MRLRERSRCRMSDESIGAHSAENTRRIHCQALIRINEEAPMWRRKVV